MEFSKDAFRKVQRHAQEETQRLRDVAPLVHVALRDPQPKKARNRNRPKEPFCSFLMSVSLSVNPSHMPFPLKACLVSTRQGRELCCLFMEFLYIYTHIVSREGATQKQKLKRKV